MKDWLDHSMLPKDSPLYTDHNAGVLGKFTDEKDGAEIQEIVCLRAKLYSVKLKSGCSTQACKGVTKSAVKEFCPHEKYIETLDTGQSTNAVVAGLRSFGHTIHTHVSTKTALSAGDTKRYILPDGVHTLPYGHYKLT
jgi:hypothetical protein